MRPFAHHARCLRWKWPPGNRSGSILASAAPCATANVDDCDFPACHVAGDVHGRTAGLPQIRRGRAEASTDGMGGLPQIGMSGAKRGVDMAIKVTHDGAAGVDEAWSEPLGESHPSAPGWCVARRCRGNARPLARLVIRAPIAPIVRAAHRDIGNASAVRLAYAAPGHPAFVRCICRGTIVQQRTDLGFRPTVRSSWAASPPRHSIIRWHEERT